MKGAKFDLIETGGGSASLDPDLAQDARRNSACPTTERCMTPSTASASKSSITPAAGRSASRNIIVANGTDASETLAPLSIGGNQEPWEFKRKIGGRLALIGGIDQFNTDDGAPDDIRKAVRKLFETVGADGGYICSASDHFFETPVENLVALAEAARECVY